MKLIYYDGIRYESMTSFCKAFNLNQKTVESRLSRNFTLEETLEILIKGKYEYKNKCYKTLRDLCDDLGLSYSKVYHRYKRYGYSLKEAIEIA